MEIEDMRQEDYLKREMFEFIVKDDRPNIIEWCV
jgi:hypothetical protein